MTIAVTITFASISLACAIAAAEDVAPPPELGEDEIILPVGLPDDEPYVEDPALAARAENTPILCGDGVDNDRDSRVDCEDRDCALFTVCAKPERPAARPAASKPRPDVEGPPPSRPSIEQRRAYRRARGLRILAHTTFWPGLAITLTSAMMMAVEGEACGEYDEIMGLCPGIWASIGGALMLTGIITGSVYRVKRKRYRPDYTVWLTPVLGDDYVGVGGVGWFG